MQAASNQIKNFNMRETALSFPTSEFTLVDKIKADHEPFQKLWGMSNDFVNLTAEWLSGPFKVSAVRAAAI